jgi:hypothetical protein
MRPDLDSSKPGRGFFVSYGHEVFSRHKAPLTVRGRAIRVKRGKGDKNKIVVSSYTLRSADCGDRATPNGRHAWGVFVYTKTHLAFGKMTRFYELLH